MYWRYCLWYFYLHRKITEYPLVYCLCKVHFKNLITSFPLLSSLSKPDWKRLHAYNATVSFYRERIAVRFTLSSRIRFRIIYLFYAIFAFEMSSKVFAMCTVLAYEYQEREKKSTLDDLDICCSFELCVNKS